MNFSRSRLITSFLALFALIFAISASADNLLQKVESVEMQTISVEDALLDLRQLESALKEKYVYLSFYENLYQLKLSDLVDKKIQEIQLLQKDGFIKLYEFKIILSELTSAFRDSHAYMALPSRQDMSLNIGLYFYPSENEYLVFKANTEIYEQLGMNFQKFSDQAYVLESINGVSIHRMINLLDPVLPYSNLTTRKNYGATILTSKKGILYLAKLMKTQKLPEFSQRFELVLKSKKTGELRKVYTNTQQPLSPWDINDPIVKSEGRPPLVHTDYSPEQVAKVFGLKFEKINSDTFYFKIPSWQPDLDPKHEKQTEKAMMDFIEKNLESIPLRSDMKMIIDVRGNRGGKPKMWRPFVQKIMSQPYLLSGLLQLPSTILADYESGKRTGDYLDYSFLPNALENSMALNTFILENQTMLVSSGVQTNDKIIQDPRLSKTLYSVIEQAPNPFSGKVYVLTDRYTFSATDTFLHTIKAAAPERVSLVGENGEGGSGTGGRVSLAKSQFSMGFGAFASMNSLGQLYEAGAQPVDLEVQAPISVHFLDRDEWYKDFILDLCKTEL